MKKTRTFSRGLKYALWTVLLINFISLMILTMDRFDPIQKENVVGIIPWWGILLLVLLWQGYFFSGLPQHVFRRKEKWKRVITIGSDIFTLLYVVYQTVYHWGFWDYIVEHGFFFPRWVIYELLTIPVYLGVLLFLFLVCWLVNRGKYDLEHQ